MSKDEKLGTCDQAHNGHVPHKKYSSCRNWREQPAPGEPSRTPFEAILPRNAEPKPNTALAEDPPRFIRRVEPASPPAPAAPCDCLIEIDSKGVATTKHADTCQYNIIMEAFARAVWRWFASVSPDYAREIRDSYIQEWKDGNRF